MASRAKEPKNLKYATLCDIYGGLLSDKQRDAVEMYYCDDLSLSEIAEHMGITRQGVRDQIKHAEEELDRFEGCLKLTVAIQRNDELSDIIERISVAAFDNEGVQQLCKKAAELLESDID